jgi:Zn-dependent protease
VFGGSFQVGRLWGIPIRVHVTLLIVLPLIAFDFGLALRPPSIIWGVVAAIGLFTSIALHEVGHSLVGARKGCPARDILLLPIGGLAQLESMPRDPRDEFQVAIAGPAVSFLLAIIGWAAGIALSSAGMHRPGTVIMLLGAVNLMLALFNLLPSFPMDGGRIFRAWLTPKLGRLTATRVAAKVGRFMAIVFGIIGLLKLNIFLILIAFSSIRPPARNTGWFESKRPAAARNQAPGCRWATNGHTMRKSSSARPHLKRGRIRHSLCDRCAHSMIFSTSCSKSGADPGVLDVEGSMFGVQC